MKINLEITTAELKQLLDEAIRARFGQHTRLGNLQVSATTQAIATPMPMGYVAPAVMHINTMPDGSGHINLMAHNEALRP